MKKIVIALGGNALGETPSKQKEIVASVAKQIVPIISKGYQVILSHGNGPQVGLINLAFFEGNKHNDKVYEMPFSECGAMSEGYIGYHLQNALQNELNKQGINKSVVSVISEVEVDKNDEAFKNPTKPIGGFYSKEETLKLEGNFKEDSGRGYRKVVASPKPIKVLQQDAISNLINNGFIVISCGGGGIPVINNNGKYEGIDAVIDKDFAAAKLANDIEADILLILTAVNEVKINFNKENEKAIFKASVQEMIQYNKQGHFASGSMKPKVEACINFVNKANRLAIITSIEKANDALDGVAGTIISLG